MQTSNKLPRQFYYKQNRLQQLRGFYYAVQTGSISKAAAKMGLTQAAISLQIQSLERDLKIKLFERKNNKIVATRAGILAYSAAAQYVQGIDDLFKGLLFSDEIAKSKEINIAANHVSISYILPKYIKKFKDQHSDVKFTIRNLDKDDAISRLMNDEIDFFIYPMSNKDIPTELEFVPIATYQSILLVDKNHKLAKKQNVTLSDIKQYDLVRIDPKFITLPAFEEIIKSHGLKSSITFEMSDWEILKRFVEAKIGVAVISNIVLEGDKNNDLIGRVLTKYFPEMAYGILSKKGKNFNGLTKEFFKMLKTEKLLDAQKLK